MIAETEFLGQDCLVLERGGVRLLLTTAVGPRILGLEVDGAGNLFAELPGQTLAHPSGARFSFYGGHRLWAAPEDPEFTYLPDDAPVRVEEIAGGVRLVQAYEHRTGLRKSLEVRFDEDGAALVDHILANEGSTAVACAPWAITQLRPGGVGILPQPKRIPGFSAFQPNRSIVLWPYTSLADPWIRLGNAFVLVDAARDAGAVKLGGPNPDGWLGYAVGGVLFVKLARYDPAADYFDLHASSQIYCSPAFIELETLGPQVVLRPGERTCHRETWQVYRDVPVVRTEAEAGQLAESLGLDAAARRTGP